MKLEEPTKAKLNNINGLLDKIASYKAVLGDKLKEVEKLLEDVEYNATVALLAGE